jgi:polyisoprenoid-binding protein YceI
LRSILTLIVLASTGVGAASCMADEMVFDLDPAQTGIQFTLGDVFHTVRGTFQLKSGTIRCDPATGKAGGEVIVDVTSGASGSKARDHRMHKDVLESQQYPQAVLIPDHCHGSLAPEGSGTMGMHGLLKIHGTEHEVTLDAQVNKKGDQLTASMHFVVPYVKWGMKNPSTLLLRVNDKVEIDIHATAHARAGTGQTVSADPVAH